MLCTNVVCGWVGACVRFWGVVLFNDLIAGF